MKFVGQSSVWRAASAGAISLLSFVACSGGYHEEVETQAQEIIGGYRANSATLNHTGVLVLEDGGEAYPFCTATLIGPATVITAKHCGELVQEGYPVTFAVGPDGNNPLESIAVVKLANAPLNDGGFVTRGQDVSVLQLEHAPTSGVKPAEPRPSSELQVGRRMVSIGYGVFGADGAFDAQRRIGRETVEATSGLYFEAMFGDFESFVEWFATGALSDDDWLEILEGDAILDALLDIYQSEALLPADEAVTGLGARDTQSCNGDSGGPLARYDRATRQWQLYGVVSGGLDSVRAQCDFGTVFATFGPEVMDFIAVEQAWQDPCAAMSAAGECQNNVASQCVTDVPNGVREVVEEDCSDANAICVVFDGGAACGSPPPVEEAPELLRGDRRMNKLAEDFIGGGRIGRPSWR